MGENSKIEWTNHTGNFWHGCTKVNTGCDHCYAEGVARHWGFDIWGNDKPRRIINSIWKDLAKYQRLAKEAGEIHRVFVGSMMDIAEKDMPLIDSKGKIVENVTTGDIRKVFFHNIDMFPDLLFLFLSKRPSNYNKFIPDSWKIKPPKKVMFGTSISDQESTLYIRQLMQVNGKKFLSVEPMVGPVDITNKGIKNGYSVPTRYTDKGIGIEWTDPGDDFIGIDWVICGGESGPHKRPFNADWARSLRDQCAKQNIPFFMKQMDKIQPIPDDLMIRQFPII